MKTCPDCQVEFTQDLKDLLPAERCSDCRIRLLLSFRNERTLYNRTCDLCKKPFISTYPTTTKHTVYCSPCWWGDTWPASPETSSASRGGDASDYGRPYDTSRPFFDQLKDLYDAVPHLGMNVTDCVNSDFTNYSDKNKDCYLIISASGNENAYYSEQILSSKDVAECNLVERLELCYWTQSSQDCYNTHYSEFCNNCTDCWFCYDSKSSKNCFGSFGLRNASFVFLNEQLDEATYKERLAELRLDTVEGIAAAKKRVYDHWKKFPHKFANVNLSENVSGDNVIRGSNSEYIFDAIEMENCRYCHGGLQGKDSQYCVPADGCEKCYNNMSLWKDYNVNCCLTCWYSNNLLYCVQSMSSNDLLGCVGMRKKKFCILNTQYSEDEYKKLSAIIIEELKTTNSYGEFFPASWCPFPYNTTPANEHYPLTKEAAEQLGYTWAPEKVIPQAPANSSVSTCTRCSSPFRILPSEAQLYARLNVIAPTTCPDCRYKERRSRRNPRKLYKRKCMFASCSTELMSSYTPDRSEVIYCESHYIKHYN